MNSALLDIISCPYHPFVAFDLIALKAERESGGASKIIDAVLLCPECKRWFSVIDGVPILMPDVLRLIDTELVFLKNYRASIPAKIFQSGKPFNLNDNAENIRPSEKDKRILEEGKYWGDFFKAHYEIGDFSILDIRQKGSHPSFFSYGILERDDRDKNRKYGFYPDHLGSMIFPRFSKFKGLRGIDVGCGGGQFGLEAAYQGALVIGADISFGSLCVAENYARKNKISSISYICSHPLYPPFKSNSFDFILFKDSIHHFENPEEVLSRLAPVLKPGADMISYEHVGNSNMAKKILDKVSQIMIPKIQKRYAAHPRSEVFARIPPNEDAGIDRVIPALKKTFAIDKEYGEIRLYLDIECLVYYATGKNKFITSLISFAAYLFEKILFCSAKPNHYLAVGRKK